MSGEPVIQDEAMRAFVSALSNVEATAPTWCLGWSAHEVVAHVTAAAEERANLIEEYLAGRPSRPTRSREEREPPFRALPDTSLRDRLVVEAARFERAVAALDERDTIVYTGWSMTARLLRTHSRSEAALHRWDLVGDDQISVRLLSDQALTDHALAVFTAIPGLLEAQRWLKASFTSQQVRFRTPGQPDVLVKPEEGLLLAPPEGADIVIEMGPGERLLVLWGRCPARLRHPHADAETVDDLLGRLVAQQS